MNSGFMKLDPKDLGKGLAVAVIVVVLGLLQQAFTAHGFDVAAFDWGSILDVAWKATAAYLAKNLFSDSQGRVLGIVG